MIAEDATHRFITDEERKAWNAKADNQHKHVMSDITDMNDNIVDGSTIRHIKCPMSIFRYNRLGDKRDDTLYIIIDDSLIVDPVDPLDPYPSL